jgi:ring-1,2-phenylacetyl-CoA epoxidase subunit PaaC
MSYDEDQLAMLRRERDYFNITLVELPKGDYAFTVLRNLLLATLLRLLWERLLESTDSEVAGIAGKAVKEARYHQQHYAEWTVRLGDGTEESHRRMVDALAQLWRYIPEVFESDEVDSAAAAAGLGPAWAELQAPWTAEVTAVLAEAALAVPEPSPYRSFGKYGRHSEHLGYILSDLQFLQRTYPGGTW